MFLDRLRLEKAKRRPQPPQDREGQYDWRWWEELEPPKQHKLSFNGEPTDDDEVPDEHPVFDPSPPIKAYLH